MRRWAVDPDTYSPATRPEDTYDIVVENDRSEAIACNLPFAQAQLAADAHNVEVDEARPDQDTVERAAKVLWETSRRDEGTISAMGADIAARALADAGLLARDLPSRDDIADALETHRYSVRLPHGDIQVVVYTQADAVLDLLGADRTPQHGRDCDPACRCDANVASGRGGGVSRDG